MSSDPTVVSSAQDTSPASPGRAGPPRTFLGATAIVGASACIIALLVVASGGALGTAVGIPVIIVAALILVLVHVFARIGRSIVATFVVGAGYLVLGAAILLVAAANSTEVVPGPALLAAVAVTGGLLTLVGATRAFLRNRAPER